MKCISCGAEIDDNSRFCSVCGARQSENNTVTADTEAAVSPAPEEAITEAVVISEAPEPAEEAVLTEAAEEKAPEEDILSVIDSALDIEPEPENAIDIAPEKSAEDKPEDFLAVLLSGDPEPEEPVKTEPEEPVLPEPEKPFLPEPEEPILPDPVTIPEEPEIPVILPEEPIAPSIPDEPAIPVTFPADPVIPVPVETSAPANELPPLKKTEKKKPEKKKSEKKKTAPANNYEYPQVSEPVNNYGYPPQNPEPVNGYGYPPQSPDYGYPQQQYREAPPPPPPIAPPYDGEFAEKNPPAPVKVGALRLTGAFMVSFCTVIIMILVTLLLCIKLGVTGDILRKRTIKMSPQTALSSELDGRKLSDAIYNETGFYDASQGMVSKDSFLGYMAKTNALTFAGDKIKAYADYIMNGKGGDPSMTNNELADFFVSNDDVANNVLDYELQTADYNRIRSRLDSKNTADNFSISKWNDKLGFRIENTKYIFSPITIGIFAALLLVLIIWIAVIVDRKGKHLLGFYGNIFCWSGFVIFLVGTAVTVGAAVAHVITGWLVFYACASLLLPFGLYALAIGAAEFILGFIMRRIKRAVRIKQKRNAAVEKALTGAGV